MNNAHHEYRPDIDGLRGVAVLAVVLNHIDSRIMPGGFVGVDVFFVISGYLITSIVQRDLERKRFSFPHFYARRARRLIPAATVMAVSSLILGYFMLLPKDFKDLGASVVAYTAMVSNVLFYRWGDYFAGQHKIWPLLHTWSLGVEEQFYVVYPLLLWLLSGMRSSRRVIVVSALLVLSLGVSIYQSSTAPRAAYFLLPSRAWELLAGALTAFASHRITNPPASRALGLGAACGVIVPLFAYTEKTPFPGWYATVPVAATALMIWLNATPASGLRAALSWKPLVALGRISYSLYLWHWPLLMFCKYPWSARPDAYPSAVPYVIGIASVFVGWLSYVYVETPGRTARFEDRSSLAWAATASAIIAVLGLIVHRTGGMPDRLPETAVRYASAETDMNPDQDRTARQPAAEIRDGRLETIGARSTESKPAFALFGDSHAAALVPLFDHMAKVRGLTGVAVCRCGTFPIPDAGVANPSIDHEFPVAAVERLERDGIPCVIIASPWSAYASGDIVVDGRKIETDEEKAAVLKRALRRTVDRLLRGGTKIIWLVRQVPIQRFHVPRQFAFDAVRGRPLSAGLSREEQDRDLGVADDILRSCEGEHVRILDVPEAMRRLTGEDLLTTDGFPIYCDDDHLSMRGALALEEAFQPIFDSLIAAPPAPAEPGGGGRGSTAARLRRGGGLPNQRRGHEPRSAASGKSPVAGDGPITGTLICTRGVAQSG